MIDSYIISKNFNIDHLLITEGKKSTWLEGVGHWTSNYKDLGSIPNAAKKNTVICCLTMEMCSEKCVARQFYGCVNITENTYTN